MKLMPPSLARAMARVSLETDCMTAEVMGNFKNLSKDGKQVVSVLDAGDGKTL